MATEVDEDEVDEEATGSGNRGKAVRTYPASSFSDCLELGQAILTHASGGRVRRLTLMEKVGRSATSGPTRQLITHSAKYGITKGSYNADWLELTAEGKLVVDDTQSDRERLKAKFALAIERIPPFKKLYDEYIKKRLPAVEVMRDFLEESGEVVSDYKECIDLFIVNAKFVGLLRTIGGSETLISIDQALDELPAKSVGLTTPPTLKGRLESHGRGRLVRSLRYGYEHPRALPE